jgi:hypothetical protein
MKIDLGDGELYLREHCPLRLSDAPGIAVRCTKGVLWMTITGEAGDIVLASGETHRIRSSGRIVIESIGGDARLRFERSTGERIIRALTGLASKMRHTIATVGAASGRLTA